MFPMRSNMGTSSEQPVHQFHGDAEKPDTMPERKQALDAVKFVGFETRKTQQKGSRSAYEWQAKPDMFSVDAPAAEHSARC